VRVEGGLHEARKKGVGRKRSGDQFGMKLNCDEEGAAALYYFRQKAVGR